MITERHFLGEWRQIRPDPRPASFFTAYEAGGRLRYTIESDTVQTWEFTWRVDGDTIIVVAQRGDPMIFRFRFQSPTMLVLERNGERSVYVRC